MDNKHKIARHNKMYENGEVSYELAMNHFGDMVYRILFKLSAIFLHSYANISTF